MARCGCTEACTCLVTGANGVKVTGNGSTENPYVIDGDNLAALALPATFKANSLLTSGATSGAPLSWTNPVADTGWLNTGVTPLNGSTIAGQGRRKIGSMVQVTLLITLGSSITVPADGNVNNTALAQMPAGFIPTSEPRSQALASGSTGPNTSWVVSSTGAVTLCAVAPGATLSAGTQISCSGMYFV